MNHSHVETSYEEKIEASQTSMISIESAPHHQEAPPRKFLWWIPLQQHVHPIQFFVFIFAVFVALACIVYLSGTQSNILTTILHVSGNTGDVTGSLALYAEIMSLVSVVVWSMASDRIQRRGVMACAIFLMGLSIVCYPHAKNVYPDLLLIRLVFAIGSAGTTAMMVALMLEVAHGKGGLVSAFIGVASGLGATFAALLLFMCPAYLTVIYKDGTLGFVYSHGIIGGITMFLGVVFYFTLPKDMYQREKVNHFKLYIPKLYRGILAAKDPRIFLGYTTSFFARADEIIISNFLSLWVTQYYIDTGKCQVGHSCYYSLASASTLSGYSQLVALAFTAPFGLASEYLPKEIAVFVAGVVGACGCIPFAFQIDPTSKACLGFVILIAAGQYGKELLFFFCRSKLKNKIYSPLTFK
jgi:MFS family permease